MKKSKVITIGLLALSIAACTSHEKKQRQTVNEQGQPVYYVDNGQGYQHGGISPFWIFYAYHMGSMGRVSSYPTYVHRSSGRNGSYHMTSNGQRSTFSRSTSVSRSGIAKSGISRGGFGSSGHSATS